MTDVNLLGTTIHEPSGTAGEAETLLFALERSRATFAWKCGGLDEAGLSRCLHLSSYLRYSGVCEAGPDREVQVQLVARIRDDRLAGDIGVMPAGEVGPAAWQ
jgi:hypothetical protein